MLYAACRVRADTYSKSKYASVISQAGGWEWFQALLTALHGVAQKHGSDIATVASKWVLDQPQARSRALFAKFIPFVACLSF